MDSVFRNLLKRQLPRQLSMEAVEVLMEPHGRSAARLVAAFSEKRVDERSAEADAVDGLLRLVGMCLEAAHNMPLNYKFSIAMALLPDRFIPIAGGGPGECWDVLQHVLSRGSQSA